MTTQLPESPPPGAGNARLAESVQGLRLAVEREARAHRRTVQAFAGALAVVAVLLVVIFIVAVDNHSQNERLEAQADKQELVVERLEFLLEERARAVVGQCQNVNEARATIKSLFIGLGELIAGFPAAAPRTPEQQAEWDRRVAPLREGLAELVGPLAPQDCSRPALGLPAEGY